MFQIAEEVELSGGVGLLQCLEQKTAKQAAEHAYCKKEARPACHPALVGRESAAGNHAVQMGMQVQILAPGMEHGEEPNLCSQMFGVVCNGKQSFWAAVR